MAKSAIVISAVSVIILAGGESRRMGRDKTQLKLGQQTLLERSVTAMAALTDDVIVVANAPSRNGAPSPLPRPARLVSDEIPGHGALSGLHAGLRAAKHAYALAVACDMPFLNPRLLRYMIVISPGYDAIVPHWQGESEPLHAVYAKSCLPAIETLLQDEGRRVVAFYPNVNVRYLGHVEIALFDPQGLSFFNINSPEDWERARAIETAWQQQNA
ncbi:MAG: molybdenum cofactor guanylyltransferase [Thermoflexales bacterium]|nr:molybdenum cofactor guanylyltransferase [Thermoflexales bacterium]